MIRINLLGGERQKTRRVQPFDAAQRVTLLCSLILALAGSGIGWWYWSLSTAAAQVDIEIAAARQEAAQLRSLLDEVQQFDARRTQLQQRVALIEKLRAGQSVPVQLLEHVSRSLPDMLWLTSVRQEGGAVTIDGHSTTLIGLSDFVGNLGRADVLKKPIEIVNSEVEAAPDTRGEPSAELIAFTVKAELAAAPVVAAGRGRAGGGR